MLHLTTTQKKRALITLALFHVLVIAASNYLVQIPFQILGLHTNWGTFSFPFIFLATDLTVRIFGAAEARKIIMSAMAPALVLSYVISVLFFQGSFVGLDGLTDFNSFVFRIALASFTAYVCGQLLDISVFAGLRHNRRWWVAPSASTFAGNLVDTAVFYSVAFYASSDAFMAAHWPEIAALDYLFKIGVSILLFVPLYGALLRFLTEKLLADRKRPAII